MGEGRIGIVIPKRFLGPRLSPGIPAPTTYIYTYTFVFRRMLVSQLVYWRLVALPIAPLALQHLPSPEAPALRLLPAVVLPAAALPLPPSSNGVVQAGSSMLLVHRRRSCSRGALQALQRSARSCSNNDQSHWYLGRFPADVQGDEDELLQAGPRRNGKRPEGDDRRNDFGVYCRKGDGCVD